MIERRLLLQLYAALHNWQAVADLIERLGHVARSKAWWSQCERGDKALTREHRNAILLCFPWSECIERTVEEKFNQFDILDVIPADENPDTALLVRTEGAPIAKATLRMGDGDVQNRLRVDRYLGNARLTPWQRIFRCCEFYSATETKTHHGGSGNLEAIRAALDDAKDAAYHAPWFANPNV